MHHFLDRKIHTAPFVIPLVTHWQTYGKGPLRKRERKPAAAT